MAITGNKGEWSEIYTFFKLLGEKTVYSGDEDLNKIPNLFYPILKVLRSEQEKNYDYSINGDIVIISEDGTEKLRKPVADFLAKAKELLDKIKKSEGTFGAHDTEAFMSSILCHKLKAKSKDKTDIRIVIHDLRTGMCPLLGFSIKSQLGGDSTLLNASQATNFTYSIVGSKFSDAEINRINNISTKSKIQDRIKAIVKTGGKLAFKEVDNSVFRNNLQLVDSFLPYILAEMVLNYFSTERKGIKEITEEVVQNNPLGYDLSYNHIFYEHKMKCFLTDVALGMMPTIVWTGEYEANGGYLVVKENGDVLCYHFYNRNLFENYLYSNTRFETASSTRNKFGTIEKQKDGSLIFKLNLQIRFK
jgi:hypothetical protein